MTTSASQPPISQPAVSMPMFPLGSVLLPFGSLPLHIFEQRYQQLLNHALEDDRRFGVVLISRGSEVGGGETREKVGTFAYIDEHSRFDDGRAAVMCTGAARFVVDSWLQDDPYPRAMVHELPPEDEGPDDVALLAAAQATFERLVSLGEELGRFANVPPRNWAGELDQATWQLADQSPISTLDRHGLLTAPTRADRLRTIDSLLHDAYGDLELMGRLDDPA